jgi:shikimate kinase / 3-dehydroquinate synthase
MHLRNIYLVGLPGSGKTTVATILARLVGAQWQAIDLDRAIEEHEGMSIPAIFARGEASFRAVESELLAQYAGGSHQVIATGGGAVIAAANREVMHTSGVVVALAVSPSIAAARLSAIHEAQRPLLQGDVLQRLRELGEQRASLYAEASLTISTDELSPEDVVRELIAGLVARGLFPGGDMLSYSANAALGPNSYNVSIGWGKLGSLATRLLAMGFPPRATIITDSTVARLFLPGILAQMKRAGIGTRSITVPIGETSKSLTQLGAIYDALVETRHERNDPIVAVGGGVVGDLAGFAAATFLRGVPLVHVPTTLLAQVDSAIGGKTGINHPAAKNIIGAFYQPRHVLIDPATLLTLDDRLLREGFGEIVKYGLALDRDLWLQLEDDAPALLKRDPALLVQVIARCAEIKVAVVSADEKESGQRMLLNYGHTIGHALESLVGYGTLLHGEAVYWGMLAEARIAERMERIDSEVRKRHNALIARYASAPLPILSTLAPESILAATRLDKKAKDGQVRYALLNEVGSASVTPVPDYIVLAALRDWQTDLAKWEQ